MRNNDYGKVILETIGDGSASIRTLKEACGVGNSINSIRKALHGLIKKGEIEPNGYDNNCGSFAYDCIMFKKTNPQKKNPIYVKGLLESPLEEDNYLEIQDIFKKRIEQINLIFMDESEKLEECIDKVSLKECFAEKYLKPDDIYHRKRIKGVDKLIVQKTTLADVLDEHPHAMVWYLKRRFFSDLGVITYNTRKTPIFKYWSGIKLDLDGNEDKQTFVEKYYKKHFDMLPINEWMEQELFKQIVIGALRESEEHKEEILWKLAFDLVEDGPGLIKFVSSLPLYRDLASDDFYDDLLIRL